MLYIPKEDIYKLLSKLPCKVCQTTQSIFNELPTVTFEVLENGASLFLDNEISYQNITIQIDIWGNDSTENSNLLVQIEEIMRNAGYRLEFSSDVPNVNNDIMHIVTRFKISV